MTELLLNWSFNLLLAASAAILFFLISSILLKNEDSDVSANKLSPQDATNAPDRFFLVRVSFAISLFAIFFLLAGIFIGLFAGLFGFFLPLIRLNRAKRRRKQEIEKQLVEALELISNSIKSGLSMTQAIELLVKEFPEPISGEFNIVLTEVRLGVELSRAIENMAKRLNSNVIYVLASGISIIKRCGGDISIVFSNIGQTIRERITIEGKLEAVTAQGRFQAMVLGMMPFMLTIGLYFIDQQHILILFTYRLGIWAFISVCLMVVLAQLWIRKLMQIDV